MTLEYDVPVYKTKHYTYIRISDLREEDRGQLERWSFGIFQPLIFENKEVIIDAIFFEDYQRYLRGEEPPLTEERKYGIILA